MPTPPSRPLRAIPRRDFLGAALMASALPALTSRAWSTTLAPAAAPLCARRPQAPYRVWFQPLLFERNIDLYAHMTIDASGWLDPRLSEAVGRTTLDWAYGMNHPEAHGPEDWERPCSEQGRSFPRKKTPAQFISAGLALDEWVPAKKPQNEAWICEGLRAGRRQNPEVFIAVWSTDPTRGLLDLARDGTVDLIIVEAYTHCDPQSPPGLVTSWGNAMRRCEAFVKAGLEEKTIFGFGHINGAAQLKGERLSGAWLRAKMTELRQRFPRMPGVAFFQNKSPDTPELRELIRACDELSAEFWP